MTSRTHTPARTTRRRTRGPGALADALGLAIAALVGLSAVRASAAPPTLTDAEIARFGRPGAAAPATGSVSLAAAEATPGCALLAAGSEQSTTAACVACHDLRQTHPVDVDYAVAAARAPDRYVPAAEVVRAGGYLPDGQIRCVTCHDRASPWKYRIALPPGAVPTPSVATMRKDPARYPGLGVRDAQPLLPGSDVTPTPLCRMCHYR